MRKLRKLIEHDQWSEILVDARSIHKNSTSRDVEILAFTDKEAIQKASDVFEVLPVELVYKKIIKESSHFWGFIRRPAHYIFSVKEELKKERRNKMFLENESIEEPHKDGSFRLQMYKEGLCLRVFSPKGLGKSVILEDIVQGLDEWGISNPDQKKIREAMEKSGDCVYLIPFDESENDNNSQIHVEIAKDLMTATMSFTAPIGKGRLPSVAEVIALLRKNNVQYGINEQYITDAINNELYNISLIVAEGKAVVNGSDEHIEYFFSTGDTDIKHAVRADGSIDFKELNVIHNVNKEEVLARIHPPMKGQQGMTILGSVILPTEGASASWGIGTNVYLSKDRSEVRAQESGRVYLKDGLICVDPSLEIESDVDLSTGHIEFLGNVVIRGNIVDGFNVVANGSIEIYGHIGKCFIRSNSHIIARQGIQGKDIGRIECKGDLFARFIERANLRVGGNLVVTKSLLHSHVICGKGVYVLGDKKSIIAGGSVQAKLEIVSNQLGAESYVETEIEVGYSDKLTSELKAISSLISSLNQKNIKLKQEIDIVSQGKNSKIAQELQKEMKKNHEQQEKNEALAKEKKQKLEGLYKAASVSVLNSVLPGVQIKIGPVIQNIKEPQGIGTFLKNKKQISFEIYRESEFVKMIFSQQSQNKNKRRTK